MGALGSKEGQAVVGDVANYASGGATMVHLPESDGLDQPRSRPTTTVTISTRSAPESLWRAPDTIPTPQAGRRVFHRSTANMRLP